MHDSNLNFSSVPYMPAEPEQPRSGRGIAWIVILLCVAIIVATNGWSSRGLASSSPAGPPRVDASTEMLGRYVIGAQTWISGAPQWQMMQGNVQKQFEDSAKTPAAKLAAVTLIAEWQGKQAALQRLDALQPQLPPALAPAAQALRTIYTAGPDYLSPAQQSALSESLGWFSQLAESLGQDNSAPQRAAVLAAARRTAAAFFVLMCAIPVALIVGSILLIVFLVRISDRKMHRHYHPSATDSAWFLQAFALYLVGFVAIMFLGPFLPGFLRQKLGFHILLMLLPTLLAMIWPLLRGSALPTWKNGMGLHLGRGMFREIGAGLLGYLAGFPIIFLSFLLTLALVKLSGKMPTHPIEKMLGGPPQQTVLVIFLASIYAPVTEEVMFRGALYHALRARHRWLFSAVSSAFIFAAVHPQGWTVMPTLMAIALVLASIREWRGTILSSATAHFLHNTVLVSVGTQMFRG